MFNKIRRWFAPSQWSSYTKYHVLAKSTYTPGLVPTLDDIPIHREVAINFTDDRVYVNVAGEIIVYVREAIPEKSEPRKAPQVVDVASTNLYALLNFQRFNRTFEMRNTVLSPGFPYPDKLIDGVPYWGIDSLLSYGKAIDACAQPLQADGRPS